MTPVAILLPVFTVLAVGLLGRTRHIGFWKSVLLCVLFTPLVGFIVAMVSGPRREETTAGAPE